MKIIEFILSDCTTYILQPKNRLDEKLLLKNTKGATLFFSQEKRFEIVFLLQAVVVEYYYYYYYVDKSERNSEKILSHLKQFVSKVRQQA
jgi:hypothetical protein